LLVPASNTTVPRNVISVCRSPLSSRYKVRGNSNGPVLVIVSSTTMLAVAHHMCGKGCAFLEGSPNAAMTPRL
jgi:hypothetical protein